MFWCHVFVMMDLLYSQCVYLELCLSLFVVFILIISSLPPSYLLLLLFSKKGVVRNKLGGQL